MDSEFGTLIDDPSMRPRQRPGLDRQRELSGEAAGAAVGEDQLEEQQRREAVQRELVSTEAAYYEDYGARLNAASWSGFECFMRYNPTVALPLLAAESTGQLVATWTGGDECLSLRFVDRYRFHYAITATSPQGLLRRWGTAHALTFFAEHPDAERLATS